jgi:hypothetical protein
MWLVKHYNEIEIHTKYLSKDLQTTAGQSKFLMHLLKFLIKKCLKMKKNKLGKIL